MTLEIVKRFVAVVMWEGCVCGCLGEGSSGWISLVCCWNWIVVEICIQ